MELQRNKVDVSVVIPYFRSGETIDRAINSILGQTVKPQEIIIVDDYSNTEEDKNILKRLSAIKNLKIISLTKNNGPGTARNRGIEESSSKYIAFLDSDDIWEEKKLEVQYEIMEQTQAYLSGHKSAIAGDKVNDKKSVKNVSSLEQLIKNRFPTRSVMMRNTGEFTFESGKRYGEDFLMWTNILLDKRKCIFIDQTLAFSFKEDFGESGLTANINNLYKGALQSYKTLYKNKRINLFSFYMLFCYQSLKHLIRIIRLKARMNRQ